MEELWTWVERLSWVVVFLGVPAIVAGVWRRSRLLGRFFPERKIRWLGLRPQKTVKRPVEFASPDDELSQPVTGA